MNRLRHFHWYTYLLVGSSIGYADAIAQEKVFVQDAVATSSSRSITLNDGIRQDFEYASDFGQESETEICKLHLQR